MRFANQASVTVVDDRRDIPEPEERRFVQAFYHFDGFVTRRLGRWLEMRPPTRATNINSMGEVPDSTWFTNRIGVRDLSIEEIRRGPNTSGDIEEHKPWKIVSSKVGGASPGFVIEDSRGERYLLKFDPVGFPEMETAADVIIQRILWACGYNVPEDSIVRFARDELILAEDAVKKTIFGDEPLRPRDVDRELERVNIGEDGEIRGLVSKFLSGTPVGPYRRDGVREDDPNDRVPHQKRRDLRGQYAIFAWLDHTDIKADNTLDTWSEDPELPGHHYLVHHLLDFGKGLGTMAAINRRPFVGHAYVYDIREMLQSLMSIGLWRRPWEGREISNLRGVGLFASEDLDPGIWKPNTPSYFPLLDADRFDNFWASKIIIRFTREQLEAIVDEAQFSDPRAARYMVQTLIERQRKVARYWFRRVNPVDEFRLTRDQQSYALCFTDLAVHHNLERSLVEPTHYSIVAFDRDGEPTGHRQRVEGQPTGRVCATGIRPAPGEEGYTILRIDTYRRGLEVPPTLVHLAEHPGTSELRVIGVRRE